MTKHKRQLSLIAAALLGTGAAHAADYVGTAAGPLRSASGECVRTGYWTASSAECDPKPVAAAVRQPVQRMVWVKVLFAFDRAEVDEQGRKSLDALVQTLRHDGVQRVVAVGHADPIGSDEYNERLSQRRADAVRAYLLDKGLPPQAFVVEAKGRQQPLTNGCEAMIDRKNPAKVIACLQPDRRVEIQVHAVERPLPQTAAAETVSGN